MSIAVGVLAWLCVVLAVGCEQFYELGRRHGRREFRERMPK